MQLIISLVEGARYTAAASSLPFLYRVVFETQMVISGSVTATACILENQGNDEVWAGYVRSVFSLPGAEQFVAAGSEVVLSVDALEHEDGPSELVPGMYDVSAKVSVRVVKPDGSIRPEELSATRQLLLL
jgi:hypothetical protein